MATTAGAATGAPVGFRRRRLAVVGAGPKAAALVAKAAVLRDMGAAAIDLDVFDPNGVGANWTGEHGYTDGLQPLCTLAERDVGYPYADTMLPVPDHDELARRMYTRYSWAAYRLSGNRSAYSKWVDAGREKPSHREFAAYLAWVFKTAGVAPRPYRVVQIDASAGGWLVTTEAGSGGPRTQHGPFDGVVITGPGNANALKGTPLARVFDGEEFWDPQKQLQVRQHLEDMRRIATLADDEGIVIVGGGGAAAAILGWLLDNGARSMPIKLIAADQAALHPRTENWFENRLFTDSGAWEELSPQTRRNFTNRLNRGVVWQSVLDKVAQATNLLVHEGRAQKVAAHASGAVELSYTRFDPNATPGPVPPGSAAGTLLAAPTVNATVPASLLIDATGFNGGWWLTLFPFLRGRPVRDYVLDMEVGLGGYLELRGPDWPAEPVHVPFLSSLVGPGYGTLMSLGGMSDRILARYLP
jgi:mycobactin lysine-N-oxygenase